MSLPVVRDQRRTAGVTEPNRKDRDSRRDGMDNQGGEMEGRYCMVRSRSAGVLPAPSRGRRQTALLRYARRIWYWKRGYPNSPPGNQGTDKCRFHAGRRSLVVRGDRDYPDNRGSCSINRDRSRWRSKLLRLRRRRRRRLRYGDGYGCGARRRSSGSGSGSNSATATARLQLRLRPATAPDTAGSGDGRAMGIWSGYGLADGSGDGGGSRRGRREQMGIRLFTARSRRSPARC